MDSGKPLIEVEVSPRFEIFYALHKLFVPATPLTDRWRKSARSRLGSRVEADARDVAPHPLIWPVLADSALTDARVTGFDDVIGAIESHSAGDFHDIVLAGAPDVPGANLRATLDTLLQNPDDYRARLVAVLRAFWSRVFAADFAALEPELKRLARQLRATSPNAGAPNEASRLGIPLSLDKETAMLRAGRGGYEVSLSRVGRVLLLPSAFNLNRWWTKREDERVNLFFPVNDGTITPNDAVREVSVGHPTGGGSGDLHPEVVFRALGDTTRYAIASILARSPATPSELARQLKVSKPTITHHVHSLRDAGLISEGSGGGKLSLNRTILERLSDAAVSDLFASEGRLKLSKTRKKSR